MQVKHERSFTAEFHRRELSRGVMARALLVFEPIISAQKRPAAMHTSTPISSTVELHKPPHTQAYPPHLALTAHGCAVESAAPANRCSQCPSCAVTWQTTAAPVCCVFLWGCVTREVATNTRGRRWIALVAKSSKHGHLLILSCSLTSHRPVTLRGQCHTF